MPTLTWRLLGFSNGLQPGFVLRDHDDKPHTVYLVRMRLQTSHDRQHTKRSCFSRFNAISGELGCSRSKHNVELKAKDPKVLQSEKANIHTESEKVEVEVSVTAELVGRRGEVESGWSGLAEEHSCSPFGACSITSSPQHPLSAHTPSSIR